MNKRTLVFWSTAISALVTFIGLVILIASEAHVRWALNQNFTFLGGNTLAALVMLFLGLMIGLIWSTRE